MLATRAGLLIAATVAAAALATGPAARAGPRAHASTPSGPGAFAGRVVRLMAHSRYDVLWVFLHPAQRETVPLARYVACERLSPVPPVSDVAVLRVAVVAVRVAGTDAPELGYAVRLRTLFAARGLAPVAVRHTVHVVPVEGRYTWILPPPRYDAYAAGRCP